MTKTICVQNGIAKFEGKLTKMGNKQYILIEKVVEIKCEIPNWAVKPKEYIGNNYVINSSMSVFGVRA